MSRRAKRGLAIAWFVSGLIVGIIVGLVGAFIFLEKVGMF